MTKWFAVCIAVIGGILFFPVPLYKEIVMAVPVAEAAEPADFPAAPLASPTRISIPSIKLNDPIERMGITIEGDLDVPSGKTSNIGWYAAGTTPGEMGSAVFDAHVYAAFKNLYKTKVGQDVYVSMSNGATLHFKITEKKIVPLSQVDNQELFNRATGKEIHLITCAGTFIKKLNTYDKRLLVYATLVE